MNFIQNGNKLNFHIVRSKTFILFPVYISSWLFKSLSSCFLHSKHAGLNTTQCWVKYGKTQQLNIQPNCWLKTTQSLGLSILNPAFFSVRLTHLDWSENYHLKPDQGKDFLWESAVLKVTFEESCLSLQHGGSKVELLTLCSFMLCRTDCCPPVMVHFKRSREGINAHICSQNYYKVTTSVLSGSLEEGCPFLLLEAQCSVDFGSKLLQQT